MAMNQSSVFKCTLLCCIVLLATSGITAQRLYKTTLKQSTFIVGSSIGLYGAAYLIEDQKEALSIDDILQLDKEDLSSINQHTVMNFSSSAGKASDYFKYGISFVPSALLLSQQGRDNAKEIAMMYAEVFSFNLGITQVTKSSFGKYRPYAYNPDVSLDFKLLPTSRRSFFSGHVSHVASLSFFTATIFDDLYPDSNLKYAVWAGAITAPAITAYLRVQAGRHFPTDVVVGYGVGALIGYLIPQLHRRTKDTDVTIFGQDGGLGMICDF